MDKKQLILSHLFEVFDNRDEQKKLIYYNYLKDTNVEELDQACRQLVRTKCRLPFIAEIFQQIEYSHKG